MIERHLEKLRDKTILITGGTGFIGSHLVKMLKPFCNIIVLSKSKSFSDVKTINADLRNSNEIFDKLKNMEFDIIFHMAAKVKMPDTKDDNISDFLDVNALGVKNMLELCIKKDVEKFIYSSSMSVFGKIISLPIDENHPKIPETIYGISKLLGEIFCREYSKLYGINTIILRYSSVYGPGMDNKWVIPTFIRCALEGKPLCIMDNISGDFIYVKDVININVLVACNELISNEDFNVGTGKETSIEELAYTIKSFFPDVKICYLKDKKLTKRFVFNISKLKSMLKYTPKYSLIDGLKELIEYIKREAYKK